MSILNNKELRKRMRQLTKDYYKPSPTVMAPEMDMTPSYYHRWINEKIDFNKERLKIIDEFLTKNNH